MSLNLLLLICLSVWCEELPASPGEWQQPTGTVRLEVSDTRGNPLGASIRIENLSSREVWQGVTEAATGRAEIGGLPFGRYRLEVSSGRLATHQSLVEVAAESVVDLKILLSPDQLAFSIDVVSATPLPGALLSTEEVPAPIQMARGRDLDLTGAIDLSDHLNRRLSGIHVNEIQGNPFQPDVSYRGYTASPLLGTPQGISVYLDGVRLNQPFGDTVSWDLIPRVAISEMAAMPGSNPVFGLNTLGGAISIETKSGETAPGGSVRLSGGSFGRGIADLEYGGSGRAGLNWYVGSTLFNEKGWRDESPSRVRQIFGRLGWQRAATMLGATVAFSDNRLNGNGLQEQRFLDRDYSSVYTKPDITTHRAPFINLLARRSLTSRLTLGGNLYFRSIRTTTFNGDINEESLDQQVYRLNTEERRILASAGYTGVPSGEIGPGNTPFPFWRCIAQVLLQDEPGEKCNGLINRTASNQANYGVAGQLGWTGTIRGRLHRLTAGAALDQSRVQFRQSAQIGYLNADRAVVGLNAFADGLTGGTIDDEPYDTRVSLRSNTTTQSLYAIDTFALTDKLNLTVSGRWNGTTIDNRDQIRPAVGPGSLTGNHRFTRFNPGIGLSWSRWEMLNFYTSYNEGSRTPTSIELGCADPETPCRLPNAMAGDPPLDQVVTRTIEAGLRGGREGAFNWSAGWFRAGNSDDILFVSSDRSGFGYFRNFGRTRREGLSVELNGRLRRVQVGGNYTLLAATFESPETVGGSGNSSSNAPAPGLEGSIRIEPGATIPLMPRHLGRAFADVRVSNRLTIDLGIVAVSRSFARGNENNLHQPDEFFYLDAGESPGYAVASLGAEYRLSRSLQIFVQISNLLNRRYSTAAQLGPTGFDDRGAFIARPFGAIGDEFPILHTTFFAPGAPRGIRSGLRLSF